MLSDMMHNVHEFSVTELSVAVKNTIEQNFGYVRVRGEISGFKVAPSGHVYFSLKDEQAVLGAVCWKGNMRKLSFMPQDGIEVVCVGAMTSYMGQSKYQLVVEDIAPAGAGALMALFEKRKALFLQEGLFDTARKKPLPPYPTTIGIITSPTGAVIRDMLHRLQERFPVRVILWPVLVQGDQAAGQIAKAIEGFNALTAASSIPIPDVLIVARGGGSIEDLWAFNEEIVVRAAAASRIPLISAVGHETDTTLIDYAADMRAPTPTAAAEFAVPERTALLEKLYAQESRLIKAISHRLQLFDHHVASLSWALPKVDLLLAHAAMRFDDISERYGGCLGRLLKQKDERLQWVSARILPPAAHLNEKERRLTEVAAALLRAITHRLEQPLLRLQNTGSLLQSYNYHAVLKRGYAAVFTKHHKPVLEAAEARGETELCLEFQDGIVRVRPT